MTKLQKILFGIIILLGTSLISYLINGTFFPPTQDIPDNYEQVKIIRVIDGDTFELEDGSKVRLLGADYPDLAKDRIGKWIDMGLSEERIRQCYDEGIVKLQEKLVNQTVLFQADSNELDADKYNRKLRYIQTSKYPDIGVYLIDVGYAIFYDPTKPMCYNCKDYKRRTTEVKENHLGCLWRDMK